MGKQILKPPVAYLVRSDFNDDGTLKSSIAKQPAFVLIQASYCPHCDDAIPIFQKIADSGIVKTFTVQIDGTSPGEMKLKEIIGKIYQDRFIPAFVLMMPDGQKYAYNGPRRYEEILQFLKSNLRR